MKRDRKVIEDIIKIGKRMWIRKLLSGLDGNLSIREGDYIYITRSTCHKGFLTFDDVLLIDLDGNIIERSDESHKPSIEKDMHLNIYKKRNDVKAIIHSHPPYSTIWGTKKGFLPPRIVQPNSLLSFGSIKIEYISPGSRELSEKVVKELKDQDIIFLAYHGVVVLGRDIEEAFFRLEDLENVCQIGLGLL